MKNEIELDKLVGYGVYEKSSPSSQELGMYTNQNGMNIVVYNGDSKVKGRKTGVVQLEENRYGDIFASSEFSTVDDAYKVSEEMAKANVIDTIKFVKIADQNNSLDTRTWNIGQ